MHKVFKVLANVTYVQPTRVVGPPRIHATIGHVYLLISLSF